MTTATATRSNGTVPRNATPPLPAKAKRGRHVLTREEAELLADLGLPIITSGQSKLLAQASTWLKEAGDRRPRPDAIWFFTKGEVAQPVADSPKVVAIMTGKTNSAMRGALAELNGDLVVVPYLGGLICTLED